MTFLELTNTLLTDMDEKNTVTITSKIKGFINRGYRELAKREGLLKKATLTVTTYNATLPTDCIKVSQVLYDGLAIPFKYLGSIVQTDVFSGSVDVIYNYVPAFMVNDADVPATNLGNEEFIINYAKWLYYLSDGLEDNAAIYKAEIEKMKIIKSPRINTIIDIYGGLGGVSNGE